MKQGRIIMKRYSLSHLRENDFVVSFIGSTLILSLQTKD